MKKSFATIALLLMVAAWAPAQEVDHPSRAQAYFFIAPIVSNTRYVNPYYQNSVVFPPGTGPSANLTFTEASGVNTGFGGEVIVSQGFGVGTEAGYAGPDWSFSGAGAVGVLSVDVSCHFLSPKTHPRADPFALGGYSLYYGDRTATQSGFNFGGGLNYWVARHAAVRLEVREQDGIHYFHSQFTRFVAFRIGMTFR